MLQLERGASLGEKRPDGGAKGNVTGHSQSYVAPPSSPLTPSPLTLILQLRHFGNFCSDMLVDYSDSEPEEQQLEGLDASDSAASGSNSHDLIHRELNVPELEVTRGSSLLRSDLNVPLPLHISLSAPLTLRTEQKDAVAAAVEASVTRSGARPFVVSPTRLCWVSNSEGSRSFLVLKLSRPENEDLNRLLSACNASVARFGLRIRFDTVKLKIGNIVKDMRL
ncbi:hypothetical protein DV738_g12, partial [Chaetothyriales sp. CBS 135597]